MLFNSKLTSLKTQIAKARQKLNRAWETYQMTDADVLVAAAELDRLCNEYERVKKCSGLEPGDRRLKRRLIWGCKINLDRGTLNH